MLNIVVPAALEDPRKSHHVAIYVSYGVFNWIAHTRLRYEVRHLLRLEGRKHPLDLAGIRNINALVGVSRCISVPTESILFEPLVVVVIVVINPNHFVSAL